MFSLERRAVTPEDDLWVVTGCWNHLLLFQRYAPFSSQSHRGHLLVHYGTCHPLHLLTHHIGRVLTSHIVPTMHENHH